MNKCGNDFPDTVRQESRNWEENGEALFYLLH